MFKKNFIAFLLMFLISISYSQPGACVYFINANTGWIVGPGLYNTTDGGSNWNVKMQFSYGAEYSEYLSSIYFINDNIGWAVGVLVVHWPPFRSGSSGKIFYTSDGGSDWNEQFSGTTHWLSSVYFTDTNTGWAVGDSGTILCTSNGGLNWNAQSAGTVNDLSSICFINANTGWAVGYNGTILHTTDGGSIWSAQSSGTVNSLTSVCFMDANIGWAVGDSGKVLHTTDSGSNWNIQSFVPTAINDDQYKSDELLENFILSQNYPNPFNPVTKINYSLVQSGFVILKIYNMLGKEVQTLVNKFQKAGEYHVTFDARNIASGIYFYKLQMGENCIATKKMILIR
jgi:photosystem II stability/assembly factor-like uncharacterized protein